MGISVSATMYFTYSRNSGRSSVFYLVFWIYFRIIFLGYTQGSSIENFRVGSPDISQFKVHRRKLINFLAIFFSSPFQRIENFFKIFRGGGGALLVFRERDEYGRNNQIVTEVESTKF